ncbi:MAG: DUF4270 family protein [Bacteroidetes bacterium]|nr:DUF4270 family protein [Bacteroidota bacterium]
MQRSRSLIILLLVTLFAETGCKENTILNANVAPAIDNVNTTTIPLSVRCRTIEFDSMVTSNSYAGIPIFHGLGTVTDPYFGKTNAGIYFQVQPPVDGFSFNTSATIDSAVLILPYSGFTWGDTSLAVNQKITAYRVTEDMSKDSVYYSFMTKAVDRIKPLGSVTVNIDHLSDSVYNIHPANGDSTSARPAHLRIKLDKTNFTDVIHDVSAPGNTELSSAAAFQSFFKGIYLEADPRSNGAAIPYFYLDGSTDYTRAGVLFYYHLPGDTTSYTQPFYYSSNTCAHFNHITRTTRGSSAETVLGQTGYNNDVVLAQNLPGCEIDVIIDNIQSLPRDSFALINKAELIITRQPKASEDIYSAPYRLYPIGIDSVGATYTIADGYPITSTAPLAFIDGVYREPDANHNEAYYVINLPREIQAALKAGKQSVHLHITGTTDYPGAYRLVAGGNSGTGTQMKFNVVYSKLYR